MKAHLKGIGEKKFLLYPALACFLGDLVISRYFYTKFADKKMFQTMVDIMVSRSGKPDVMIDQNSIEALYAMVVNSLVLMLALMILLHLFNYFFFAKKKNLHEVLKSKYAYFK